MTPGPGEYSDGGDWQENEQMTRPRGILSPKERAHLSGWLEEDPKEDADAIRQREYRIRQHIFHSFSDLAMRPLNQRIRDVLSNEVEATIAGENEHPDWVDFPFTEIGVGAMSIVGSLYDALEPIQRGNGITAFDDILQEGIGELLVRSHAEEGESVVPNITLKVEFGEKMPIDELESVFYDHDREEMMMLPDEMSALLHADSISVEEHNEYTTEMSRILDENPERYSTLLDAAFRRRGYEDVSYRDLE